MIDLLYLPSEKRTESEIILLGPASFLAADLNGAASCSPVNYTRGVRVFQTRYFAIGQTIWPPCQMLRISRKPGEFSMTKTDYPACLRELIESEIFGESFSLALLEEAKADRDYYFATLLQLETETKARLRPL